MARHIALEIGGVRFSIQAGPGMSLEEPSQAYQPFIRGYEGSAEGADIFISVETGGLPETDHLTRVFDGGRSWSLFRAPEGFVISLKPQDIPEPLWVASTDPGFTRVTLQCSDQILSREDGIIRASNPVCYPLDQILLMNHLAHEKGTIIHAAGVNACGKGLIFPGKSGAGKTALSRLLSKGARTPILSDDRMVLRKKGETFQAFGTPWPGDLGVVRNQGVPLRAVLFLHHGKENEIKPISPGRALEKMMAVVSVPWYDKRALLKTLAFCEGLVSGIPQYELHFRKDGSTVQALEEWMAL